MPDNAFVKIGTALLKHQIKKLVGEDKLDGWLGDKSTVEELEKAAKTAETEFKFDAFISYSHKDEEWSNKILHIQLDITKL